MSPEVEYVIGVDDRRERRHRRPLRNVLLQNAVRDPSSMAATRFACRSAAEPSGPRSGAPQTAPATGWSRPAVVLEIQVEHPVHPLPQAPGRELVQRVKSTARAAAAADRRVRACSSRRRRPQRINASPASAAAACEARAAGRRLVGGRAAECACFSSGAYRASSRASCRASFAGGFAGHRGLPWPNDVEFAAGHRLAIIASPTSRARVRSRARSATA
jgi:hypothetical protein